MAMTQQPVDGPGEGPRPTRVVIGGVTPEVDGGLLVLTVAASVYLGVLPGKVLEFASRSAAELTRW